MQVQAPGQQRPVFIAIALVVLGFIAGFFLRTPPEAQPPATNPPPASNPWLASTTPNAAANAGVSSPEHSRGAALARQVCATCHLFPEPASLDKATWGLEILPRMANWLGGTPFEFDRHPGGDLVRAAGIIPQSPVIGVHDWRAICVYYLAEAPSVLPAPAAQPAPLPLKQFQVFQTAYRRDKPMTTLVKIDSQRQKIYVGDAGTGTLEVLNPVGAVEMSLKMGGSPVSLTRTDTGWYVTLLGEFFGSDLPQARLILIEPPRAGAINLQPIINEAPRTTDTVLADLDLDGKSDLVVSHFGNILGRFSWYRNLGDNRFEENVLLQRSGAIRSYVRDFNGDKLPDIIVLMAQAWEGIWLYTNRGNGKFEESVLLQQPAAWGFSDFELADFNGDGAIDIIAANGDNGDNIKIPPATKPYHGARIYLNDGKNRFSEAWFYPLPGAYKVLARDFDNDGDLDLASIAFYADYERLADRSFLYWENTGQGKQLAFTAYSLPESLYGRWVTADAGDVDGDGDIDLVLGSFQQGFSPVPAQVAENWQKHGQTILILSNTLIPRK